MKWRYVKPTSFESINEIEVLYGVRISNSLKSLIFEANNGRPELDMFDTASGKGKQFKKLLSYNKEDEENMFSIINLFKGSTLFPFGDDSAGNFLCIKEEQVVFFNHETQEIEFVAESLDAFINNLY